MGKIFTLSVIGALLGFVVFPPAVPLCAFVALVLAVYGVVSAPFKAAKALSRTGERARPQ